MLGILIPGVREVRAPLVAGSLALVAVYLLLFDAADSLRQDEVSPAMQSVYDTLGRNGLLIAGAIAAYLLGTVFVRLAMVQMRGLSLRLIPLVATTDYLAGIRPRWLHFLSPYSGQAVRRISELCDARQCVPTAVLADIVVSGGKRLLIANRDLYAEYDRLRSEIEFRLAVVAPSLLLVVAVVLQVPASVPAEVLSVLVIAVIGGFILADAIALNRQSNSMYAHAVADGVVGTPSLDVGRAPAST